MSAEIGYYTTSEVAKAARVDPATVRRWVRAGQLLPAQTTPGGHHRFDPAEVDRLLAPHLPSGRRLEVSQ